MPVAAGLDVIVEALEMLVDESPSYLDLDTGQVVTVSEDLLSEAEEPGDEEPNLPDWQKDEWAIAKRIVSTDRFLKLRRCLMCMSGRLCRISHARWGPML